MRTKAEIKARLDEKVDALWYYRHVNYPMPDNTPDDIRQEAERQAERIRAEYDEGYLTELLRGDGPLINEVSGQIIALRWMLGADVHSPAILDT